MAGIDVEEAARVLLTLTRRMRRSYTAAAEGGTMEAAEIVEDTALMPQWAPGKYSVGAVRQKDGQPYRCAIEHDSTVNTDWIPGAAPTVWYIYHATTPAGALPYVQPQGAHDVYMTGEYILWADKPYKCVVDNTVHDPGALPGSWEVGV